MYTAVDADICLFDYRALLVRTVSSRVLPCPDVYGGRYLYHSSTQRNQHIRLCAETTEV